MAQIQTILFDLDGTLISVKERLLNAFNITNKTFNLPEISLEKFTTAIFNRFIPKEEKIQKQFIGLLLSKFHSMGNKFDSILPNVEPTLKKLKDKGYEMAIVTGRMKRPRQVRKELEKFHINQFFKN